MDVTHLEDVPPDLRKFSSSEKLNMGNPRFIRLMGHLIPKFADRQGHTRAIWKILARAGFQLSLKQTQYRIRTIKEKFRDLSRVKELLANTSVPAKPIRASVSPLPSETLIPMNPVRTPVPHIRTNLLTPTKSDPQSPPLILPDNDLQASSPTPRSQTCYQLRSRLQHRSSEHKDINT
ncbi:hypothetical protein RF11_09023 [Thelohanellus kitauei]|uniref:Uncharacterized protein n=1 Tax=Thelohanellus kitauei TaxID=669202 RepID=A0A0C2JK09_THEKT|nr:hypothetical protein RF11_09023 [Thelohanellus kitauei]